MENKINVNGFPYSAEDLRQVCETRDRLYLAIAEKYAGLVRANIQRLIERETKLREELGLWEMNLNGVPVSRVLNK